MNTARELSELLRGTMLEGREVVELPVLDTGEKVLVVRIGSQETEAAWRVGRSLLATSGRWPLVASFWSDGPNWTEQARSTDLFSRFYYNEAPAAGDASPQALCALAGRARLDDFLERKIADLQSALDLDETIDYQLDDLAATHGEAPDADEVRNGKAGGHAVTTAHDVERYLLDWEEARDLRDDPGLSRQPWFEQDPCGLLFLPSPRGSDALAYIHWYGSSYHGVENYIALLRSWEQRFGAELVAHHGTMLQFLVSRPPQDLDEAWPLACEHDLAGGCTLPLPGIKVRDYARALIGWDRWFLHERP